MLFDKEFTFTQEETEKIEHLRSLLECNRDVNMGTEDAFLAKFLNYTNWHVERAFTAVFRYYNFKSSQPSWHYRPPLEYYRNLLLHTKSRYVLRQPDRNGRFVFVLKAVDAFDQYPNYFHDMLQFDDLLAEALMLLPKVQKSGATVIHDVTGTTKKFLRLMTPTNMRLLVEKNEVLPLKDRFVHIVQKGFMLNAASNALLGLMSKNFKEKIVTHEVNDLSKLRDAIGYESLPADYGGPSENVADLEFTWSLIEKHSEYLARLCDYKVNKRQ